MKPTESLAYQRRLRARLRLMATIWLLVICSCPLSLWAQSNAPSPVSIQIVSQPVNQFINPTAPVSGSAVSLSVTAIFTAQDSFHLDEPISCYWQCNGTNIYEITNGIDSLCLQESPITGCWSTNVTISEASAPTNFPMAISQTMADPENIQISLRN